MRSKYGRTVPTKIKGYAEEFSRTSVGEGLAPPEKTTAHRTYRFVEIKGALLNPSLPQWGKGDHEVVDEVFFTANQPQSVCR